jgi:hypothetical protein
MGFEVVVRPVVFPNIRPAPAQPSRAADDPTQGLATINGSGGQFLDLQYSNSINSSSSNPTETRRRVDVVRVYQKEDGGGGSSVALARGVVAPRAGNGGNINRDNFVDIEVANRIWMKGSPVSRYNYARVQETDNIEIRERNKIKRPGE